MKARGVRIAAIFKQSGLSVRWVSADAKRQVPACTRGCSSRSWRKASPKRGPAAAITNTTSISTSITANATMTAVTSNAVNVVTRKTISTYKTWGSHAMHGITLLAVGLATRIAPFTRGLDQISAECRQILVEPANVTCSLFFQKQSERSMLVLSGVRYCVTVPQIRSSSPREVAFALSDIHALVLIRRTDGRP